MPATASPVEKNWDLTRVIFASSLGTLIEWYDFYLFGALAPVIARQFFPVENPTAAFLAALATFAAGFVVRPFGALVFGRLGDLVGRKHTFLVTLVLMGLSTFCIGLVPSYAKIGAAAPLIVLFLRLLQGLALGGEYGGAATYVAEFAPEGRRGFFTSFIQTTATVGFFISLAVILGVKKSMPDADFEAWGWRLPFLLSIFMVAVSVYIRLKMAESPLFSKMKAEGQTSKNPLKESFGRKANLRIVLLALFGVVMGQGVVWYTGQFYAQTFIERTCGVDFEQTRWIMMTAIAGATGGFVLFGWLSDKWGRKWIMLAGIGMAVLSYRPIYRAIFFIANPFEKTITPPETSFSINEKGDSIFLESTFRAGLNENTTKTLVKKTVFADRSKAPKIEKTKTVWLSKPNFWRVAALVFLQILWVTMVYGPIAAFLVELFPTRIRYTSMSLPYHIGNGIFGGLTPLIATRLFDLSKENGSGSDPFVGLWYPILVGGVCFFIGLFYLKNGPENIEKTTKPTIFKKLKPVLGIVWAVVAVAVFWAMAGQIALEFSKKPTLDTRIFWYTIVPIFLPIVAGLVLFGWYCLRGEYED